MVSAEQTVSGGEDRLFSLDALRGFDMLFLMGLAGVIAEFANIVSGVLKMQIKALNPFCGGAVRKRESEAVQKMYSEPLLLPNALLNILSQKKMKKPLLLIRLRKKLLRIL